MRSEVNVVVGEGDILVTPDDYQSGSARRLRVFLQGATGPVVSGRLLRSKSESCNRQPRCYIAPKLRFRLHSGTHPAGALLGPPFHPAFRTISPGH